MTTTPPDIDPVTPVDVVAAAFDVLGDLDQVLWAAKSPEDLLKMTLGLERLRSRLSAVGSQVAAEVEAKEAAKTDGWASSGDYLTAVAGGRKGAGQRRLRTARALVSDRQATLEALHAGDISPDHADVIVRVIDLLPVNPSLRDKAEALLLVEARRLDATDLRTTGERLLEVLDPEGVAKRDEKALSRDERSAHLNRFLNIKEDGLGGVRIRGRGTVEDAAVIKAALSALSAPLPSTDPECGEGTRDPRDHGARTWDAMVEACQRLLDAEVLPESHGAKPRVTITIDYDALRSGLGTGVLDTGESLSASAVRKLCCDADVIPAVLGGDGEVLDVGRQMRLACQAIWRALVLRDRHCRFPGCRRPPIACDAHHVVHWIDGGETSEKNMVLLCRAHHTVIHTTQWEVRMNPYDGRPEFRPPPGRHRLTPEFRERLDWRDEWVRERQPRA